MDSIYGDLGFNIYTSKFLQSGGSSHISVVKGITVTFTSQTYGADTVVPMIVFSNLYMSLYSGTYFYFVTKTNLDYAWTGVQLEDMIPLSTSMVDDVQTSYAYSVGVTGSGTNTLVWNTTNVPSKLYFLGTQMEFSDAPMSVFVMSLTPTTLTYSPIIVSNIALTAACLGDTLILNKPIGDARFDTVKDIHVSCISLTDPNDPPAITVVASGGSPLTWVVSGVDNTQQCYISYGPLPTDSWYGSLPYYSLLKVYDRPVTPRLGGDWCLYGQQNSCPSHSKAGEGAYSLAQCYCDPGYYGDTTMGGPDLTICQVCLSYHSHVFLFLF
jgi:hypothetical protein